jgi:glutamate--cysteine ligase
VGRQHALHSRRRDQHPIAEYGRSNLGFMKHVYRRGLAWRYGRIMQVIAGIHFNFSLSDEFWTAFQDQEGDRRSSQDFRSESYFGLIRNLQRFGWLILYLFGASPAVCKSFLDGKVDRVARVRRSYLLWALRHLAADEQHRLYQPHREKERRQRLLQLAWPSTSPVSPGRQRRRGRLTKIGVKVDGDYRQLNANVLQIENEYYASMRPKQPPRGNEKPTLGLKQRGVQYVELRSVDINPLEPLGVTAPQLRFLEAFLLFCLLNESPPLDAEERRIIDDNQMAVALTGRDSALVLHRRHEPSLPLRRWADQILDVLQPICELLDIGDVNRPYAMVLAEQREALVDPDRTPSARMLAEMRASGENFFRCAQRISEQHRRHFEARPLAEERVRFFAEAAEQSWRTQREIEAADDVPFDEFLRRYFAQP